MKVSEAKEKICPFMQSINIYATSGVNNRSEIGFDNNLKVSANINCICGDCMAWEYTFILEITEAGKAFALTKGDTITKELTADCGSSVKMKELPEDEKEGYCQRLSHDN